MFATFAPWLALVTIAVVIGVAFRKRWKSTPVLVRCVVLSVYAHLLFATAAYTTRLTPWQAGAGSGQGSQEVRVRFSSEMVVPPLEQTEPLETPPWEPVGEVPTELALTPSSAVREEVSSNSAPQAAEENIAPPMPPTALPELPRMEIQQKPALPSALTSVAEVLAEVAPRYADSIAAKESSPQTKSAPSPPAVPVPSPQSPVPQSAISNPQSAIAPTPDLYKLRFADRAEVLESSGGNLDTEAAVELALAWLVANQEADGRWSAARHGAGRGQPQQGQDRGDSGADADTGITALAVLALMGNGHTHYEGKHHEATQHGLEFLLASQRSDGCLAGDAKLFASMYCHGMATLALAEAMAVTRDPRLKPFVERAVAYSVSAQHSGGGWRYQPGDIGDMSQFGWQVMALKSAELAGVTVPDITKQRAQRFLQTMSSGRSGGLASYRANDRISRTMTAEALLCRYLLTHAPSPATRDEATAYLLQELPTSGAPNVYYWYYGTLAMRFSGGTPWQRWNEALQKQLLQSQRRGASGFERSLAGSWDPDRVWGGYGGRVYQTSLSALCLESYYRYDTASLDGAKWR
jgi:hypothetical protein